MAASTRSAVAAAAAASAAMIAFQVGGKATRDALFLSSFPLTMLPTMVIVSSILSVLTVLYAVRRISRQGPWRFIPGLFAASTTLLLVEWALIGPSRQVTAVIVYLHFTILGALLISGFWSMVNERFDPRTAKRQIGRIGAAGTIGGVVGGLLAERTAAMFSIEIMLPVLAALHLIATLMTRSFRASRPVRPASTRPPAPVSTLEGLRLLGTVPYLRNLVLLVVLCTVAEGLLDFVFKGSAAARYGNGEQLLRLFAAFYTGVSILTFLIQGGFARLLLDRLGLAGAVTVLPGSVAIMGTGAFLFPGLASAAIARGTEAVFHNSLFRSGYELLFTPIQKEEKRATKTLIDVGSVRLGDVIGGGIVQASLLMAPAYAFPSLLVLAVILSLVAVFTARTLRTGYREALEKNLIAHGGRMDEETGYLTMEHATGLETITAFDVRQLTTSEEMQVALETEEIDQSPAQGVLQSSAADEVATAIRDLRSRDREKIRAVLGRGPIAPVLVPHVIPLLAWDEVARFAGDALRAVAPRIIGQLLDAMLDPEEEFTIRRRIPGILIAAPSQRTVEGLLYGLADRRFEVRYRSGRALAELHEHYPELELRPERIFDAILREVTVDRQIWESQRLLGEVEDRSDTPFLDDFLRERAGRSMEHVFTVLSLVLPGAPLKIAFRGLFTNDDNLRGTALEYLENALPDRIRARLWPFLEDRRPRNARTRDREDIIADLMRSNDSISLNLEEIRRRVSRSSGEV
jgi:AAA family ATP:ADP antiporter